VRFFTGFGKQEKIFAIFVESGFNRDVDARVSHDRTSVDIHISMPEPPDALIQAAGLKATHVSLAESNQIFTVKPPKKLSTKHRELLFFPNKDLVEWFIFKYEVEQEVEEHEMKAHFDLSKFLNKSNQQ
jgi:hypothetical protein